MSALILKRSRNLKLTKNDFKILKVNENQIFQNTDSGIFCFSSLKRFFKYPFFRYRNTSKNNLSPVQQLLNKCLFPREVNGSYKKYRTLKSSAPDSTKK